jgi:hypothetical protein
MMSESKADRTFVAFTADMENQRQSKCGSCGRMMPPDPSSPYFIAQPVWGFDSDWCGCARGSGT